MSPKNRKASVAAEAGLGGELKLDGLILRLTLARVNVVAVAS